MNPNKTRTGVSSSRPVDMDENDQSGAQLLLEDDLLVVAVWTAMGIFGIVTNVVILAGICRSKKLRQSASYWLMMSLSFCDIGMLVVCLAHLIPATVLHERYMKIVDFSNAFGVFVYDAFWYTGVLHLMVMSINRYVNICRPKHYHELFSRRKTASAIVLLHCCGTALAAPGLFSCCYVVFNYDFYAAQYEPADTPYRFADMAINGSSVVVMTFCYICIVLRVRRSRIMLQQYRKLCREQTKTILVYAKATMARRQNSVSAKLARLLRPQAPITSRREVKLFFQFATVSVIFFLTFFTWSWLPHLSSDSKWIGFAVTLLFFVNNSINPVVYLVFNSVLRRQIHKIFCPFSSQASTAVDRRKPEDVTLTNQQDGASQPPGPAGVVKGRRRVSLLRRLQSSGSLRRENVALGNGKQIRRRSAAFDPGGDARLLRISGVESSANDTTENNGVEANATCNLMAMAAFLNTTTITGGVLLRTIREEQERKMVPRPLVQPESDAASEANNSGSEEARRKSAHGSLTDFQTEIDQNRHSSMSEDSRRESDGDSLELHDSRLLEPLDTNAVLTDDDEPSIHF